MSLLLLTLMLVRRGGILVIFDFLIWAVAVAVPIILVIWIIRRYGNRK